MSDQLQAPAALRSGKEPPRTPRIGGWVGRRAGLNELGRRTIPFPFSCRELNPGRLTHSLVVNLTELPRLCHL